MKIEYLKKRLYSNLVLGGIFSVLGFLQLLGQPGNLWVYYLQLFFGISAVGAYFYEKHFHYLNIEKGIVTKNSLRRKSIPLTDIQTIQSFPGKIKLLTSKNKLSINTDLIEAKSRKDLLSVLGALNIENNPFTGYAPKTS